MTLRRITLTHPKAIRQESKNDDSQDLDYTSGEDSDAASRDSVEPGDNDGGDGHGGQNTGRSILGSGTHYEFHFKFPTV